MKDGLKEGKGILYYINEDKYEGEFKGDFKHGKGILYPLMEVEVNMKEILKMV
jgi:hypothetical protein